MSRHDRQPRPKTSHELLDLRRDAEAAVEEDTGQRWKRLRRMRHEHAEQHVDSVARRDDDSAFDQPVQDVGERHGADQDVEGLSAQQFRITAAQVAAARLEQVADGRSGQQRLLGDDVHRHGSGQGLLNRVELVRVHPVGDDCEQASVPGRDLGGGDVGDRADVAGRSTSAMHHEEDRRTQVCCRAGVVRELGGAPDAGVVAADDDHCVVVRCRLVVPVDDRRHGTVGVGVHPVVAHSRRQLVGHVDALVIQQEFQHIVRPVVGANDRAEHADPADSAGQQIECS